MIDIDRIAKAKTDTLNVYEQIDTLVKSGKEDFLKDPKSPLALKYLLIEAVEAITDICQHLLAKSKGIACEGYIDCILKTGKEEIITISLANKLRRLADLRNNLIHRYWNINDEQLYTQTVDNKSDLLDFVEQVNTFIESIRREK
ncbi:MAG: hypothetical protein SCARUB_02136 [Candidatus Scalindua rubra]|uniref:DUF86 domain-containing protein n=1 Tax=Candidatus Scalindua rubra TaxID=1872076 RepID=A0A1E3XAY0_9BACT|nr:MAG: hypothetical protein SCARUB_02136 [Candidatus Scalindua rubra]